jgi:Fic family protein
VEKQELDHCAKFLFESERCEGLQSDLALIKQQLGEGWARGHVGALVQLYALAIRREPLTEKIVKETQRLITEEQPDKGARQLSLYEMGQWRRFNIFGIGVRSEEIPDRMTQWFASVKLWEERCGSRAFWEDASEIGALHWEYERIHPFADGNGRSGRVIVYSQYIRAGLLPFVFTSGDKKTRYDPCFQYPNTELMRRYFLDRTRYRLR